MRCFNLYQWAFDDLKKIKTTWIQWTWLKKRKSPIRALSFASMHHYAQATNELSGQNR